MALEIGEVADRHLAQDDALADRGIAPEPARFQLRGRMDARLGILEDEGFRDGPCGALYAAERLVPQAGPIVRQLLPAYFGLPLVHTTFWP